MPPKMKKIFLSVFLSTAFLFAGTNTPGHIGFGDSATYFRIRGTIGDSLSVSRFTNTAQNDKHIENSVFANLYVNGAILRNFTFRASASVMSDWTNRLYADPGYNPYNGIPFNVQGDKERTWDYFTASSEYDIRGVAKVMGGIDYIAFGPARRNKLTLRGSDNPYRPWMDSTDRISMPAPTPYFGYELKIGPVTYTQYSGKLYHDKHKDKFFHAHRLNLALPFDIDFGISETLVYGSTVERANTNPNLDADSTDRHFQWLYAAPFVPYIFAQHYTGDLENTGLGFDIRVRTIRNWEFYGEMFWDDMKKVTSMFDDSWWGNKWAASIGIATDKRKIGPILFSYNSEFTWIEPWVYTHHKGMGYTYLHYGQSLGSNLGPNSREFFTQIKAEYKVFEFRVSMASVAKDSSFGGNIEDIHTPYDRTDRKYLSSRTTKRYGEYGLGLRIVPCEWLFADYVQTFYTGDFRGYRASGKLGVTW